MNASARPSNRFQDFFSDSVYIFLKNHLYNYLLRKRAIAGILAKKPSGWVVEVGSGISPVSAITWRTVYTDVSLTGLKILKGVFGKGNYVVADGTALPFKSRTILHCVSSEVIEHIENDVSALREMARVLKPEGCCVITFPHRAAYFALDDVYVNHYRRYNLEDISHKLNLAGLSPRRLEKVLGPLEKISMITAISLITLTGRVKRPRSLPAITSVPAWIYVPLFQWCNRIFSLFALLDAKIMPRSMSAVILIEAERINKRPE